MHPKVSIITVNYHQKEVTADLLSSIAAANYPNLEVILVDNEQKGHDGKYYQKFFEDVRVLNSATNLGFAGANNLGIKRATGDFLFFLNNDTILPKGVIETLLEAFLDSDTGAACPVIRYAENPDKIQYAGFTKIHPITGRNQLIQDLPTQKWRKTAYLHGAAVMISRETLDKIGGMPEEYFLYYEELDWSSKITRLGLKIRVSQEVSIIHKESMSTGKNSPLKVYYQTRNRIHFMKRNSTLYPIFLMFFLLISLPKGLVSQRGKHAAAFRKGVWDGLILKKVGWTDSVLFA